MSSKVILQQLGCLDYPFMSIITTSIFMCQFIVRLFAFSLFFTMVQACVPDQEGEDVSRPEPSTQVEKIGSMAQSDQPPSVVPTGTGIQEIVGASESTWIDLHEYYQRDLPKHEGAPYYKNLRSETLHHLLATYRLVEHADLETVEFYTREILSMEFFFEPRLLAECLRTLQGRWNEQEVQNAAANTYSKSLQFINENFDESSAQKLLDLKREGLAELKVIAGPSAS